jgi:hypothetical protein
LLLLKTILICKVDLDVRRLALFGMFSMGALWGGWMEASGATPVVLTLKNHRFNPEEISAPAGQRFTIQVRNLDDTPEEFESYDMKVEKIIAPHGTVTVSVGSLKPGTYKFFGDYNPALAHGALKVAPAAGGK